MRILDLFAGTQSLRKTLGGEHHVMSVDLMAKTKPDICADILTWDYRVLQPGQFDVVWASPPCTQYSKAKSTGVRDIEGANRLVARALEIIQYLKPKVWFMENPQTGKLKDQPVVAGLPFYDVSYCKYGYPYRKQTRIWTNLTGFEPRSCTGDCPAIRLNPATGRLQHECAFSGPNIRGRFINLDERNSVPPMLIRELFEAARRA